jgi:hypothetical protein
VHDIALKSAQTVDEYSNSVMEFENRQRVTVLSGRESWCLPRSHFSEECGRLARIRLAEFRDAMDHRQDDDFHA